MRKLYVISTACCVALTFIGAGYVLFSHGRANAGFAVIPMVFTSMLLSIAKKDKK